MDKVHRIEICRLIAGLVMSDDDYDPAEDHFIDRVLAHLEIPTERNSIFPVIPPEDAAAAMERLPNEVREEALGLLVNAACADGKVVEQERDYLHRAARTLGMRDAEMDRLIAVRLSLKSP